MNSSQFSDSRLIEHPHAHPLVTKLLRRYGLKLQPAPPTGSALVNLKVVLPPGSALLWDRATSLPLGHQRRELLRFVSITVQETLRCWIPYLYFSHLPNWDLRELMWPMLIYGASRSFKPVSRQTFTFDLMRPDTLPTILHSALPTLKSWGPRLQEILQHQPGARREMGYFRLQEVIQQRDFIPQHLWRLLSHEHQLIVAFMNLADSQADLTSRERIGLSMHQSLTRLYTNADFSLLSPLLYLELENMISRHLLGRPILQASVQVAPPSLETLPAPLPKSPSHYAHYRNVTSKQPNSPPPVHTI
ncbi:MAG: hypothetical protein K2X03_29565 [Bryobacteraceae bacterium]|nr:hypothetical protein [Bryobacteraceae bacterium]